MRSLILSALMLLAVNAVAQNWALLNPAYKYNFSDDGTDTISSQVFVTGIDTLGPDSFMYQLNRISRYCPECLPACNLEIDEPQFLMRNCAVSAGVWTFLDTSTYIINPIEQVGASWLFAPNDGTAGTIVAAGQTNILGSLDSTKTMATANGDTIIWSKSFGILRWDVSGGGDQRLTGVHGPQLGSLIPSLAEFFLYQPGDVVEFIHGGFYAWDYSTTTRCKLTIQSRTAYQDSIFFDTYGLFNHQTNQPQSDDFSSGPYTWRVSRNTIPMLGAIFSSPEQFIHPDSLMGLGLTASEGAIVTQHGLTLNGHYEVRARTIDYFTILGTSMPIDSSCLMVYSYGIPSYNELIFDTQVGLRSYVQCLGSAMESYEFLGGVIAGDTVGAVSPDQDYHVSINDLAQANAISLFPNPASDKVVITSSSLLGSWILLDATGREVLSGDAGERKTTEVVLQEIPTGLYLLRMSTPLGLVAKRMMVAR